MITDERLERIIAYLLRAGVLLSAAVVLAGGICYLIAHRNEPVDYHSFGKQPDVYRTVSGVLAAAVRWDCRAVIQLGLLLLIATPIARVALSLVAFAVQRDRTYIVVTAIVLMILLFSLLSAHVSSIAI